MKHRTVVLVGIFLAWVIVGAVLGLLLVPGLREAASDGASAQGGTPPPSIAFDGRLVVVTEEVPGIWKVDRGSGSPGIVSFRVTDETQVIANGISPVPGVWAHVEALKLASGLEASLIILEATPRPVVVDGVLQAVSSSIPGRWVIDDYPFEVVEDTQLITNGIVAEVGATARAELLKLASGLRASVVELMAPAGDGSQALELVDHLVAIDEGNNRFTVGATEVQLGPDTAIEGEPEEGSLLRVRGVRTGSALLAERILVIDADEGVVHVGVIQSLSPTSWVIDGVTALIDNSTTVEGEPAVGLLAQVQGTQVSSQAIRASLIRVEDSGHQELIGWLQSQAPEEGKGTWQVGLVDGPEVRTVSVELDEETLVDAGSAPVEYGAWLRILAASTGSNQYRARFITVLPNPPKQQIVGVVTSRPASGRIGVWHIGAYRVTVDDQTSIAGNPDIGDMVEVAGTPDRSATLHAVWMQVLAR